MSQLWQFALVGLAGGGAYALVALGVVAVYKGSGILNFAQGAIGMIAAYTFWDVYDGGRGSLQVVPAMAVGVAVGAALGVLFYIIVVRQLRNTSDMAKVVATLGLTLLLQAAAEKRYGTESHLLKPLFGSGRISIGSGFMTNDTLALLVITVSLAIVLWLMFTRTKLGMNATALRENPQAAAAIGISPVPTGVVTWGVGGALAAVAGILLIPVISLTPSALTLLVIPAMAAALVGGFNTISTTVIVGFALGVAESVLAGKFHVNPGIVASLPFGVIIVAVVLGGRALPGRGEALTVRLPRVGNGRINPIKVAILLGLGIGLPLGMSPTWSTAMINSCIFGLLALSIVVVTGYAGQISVASAALAGFGSFIAARCSNDVHLPFIVCILFGTITAVVLGIAFGAPAVRVRGINLAIVTLGLSLAVEDMVLNEPSLTGGVDGLAVHHPTLFGMDLSPAAHPDRFAIVCVVILGLSALAVYNIRRGASGRRYVSVRANERGAASVGVSVAGAKLGAFAVSAGIAGVAGALATFQFQIADFSSYGVFTSITALTFTVLAGIGFVGGAIAASVVTAGGLLANIVSNVFHWNIVDAWSPIIGGAAVMDIMIRMPDGFIVNQEKMPHALLFKPIIRLVKQQLARRRPVAARPAPAAVGTLPRAAGVTAGETVLVARGVRVAFGNVIAVEGMSLELTAGKVVGIIGPNGAGKTSLIDGLTGFKALAGGTVEFRGQDVTGMRAHQRARLGMARTFQNLELFDDLSVLENIQAALDTRGRMAYAADLVVPRRGRLNEAALAAVAMLGLAEDLDVIVGDLPSGRRRMVAIARLVAQQPAALLLDEPAAGLNGSERRTASSLFRALADQLGAAVLLVEHNVDVVASCVDHLIVLDFGRVIASGPTADVLREPVVREAYLGRITEEGRAQAQPVAAGETS